MARRPDHAAGRAGTKPAAAAARRATAFGGILAWGVFGAGIAAAVSSFDTRSNLERGEFVLAVACHSSSLPPSARPSPPSYHLFGATSALFFTA